ncbi:hypothetical protein P9112_006793 [Eukaryota sp. TZLM1-RC]
MDHINLHDLTLDQISSLLPELRTVHIQELFVSYNPSSKPRNKRRTILAETLFSSSVYRKLINAILYIVRTSSTILSLSLIGLHLPPAAWLKLMELLSKTSSLQSVTFSSMKVPLTPKFFHLLNHFPLKITNIYLINIGLNDDHSSFLSSFLVKRAFKLDNFKWENSLRFNNSESVFPLNLDLSFNNFTPNFLINLTNTNLHGIESINLAGLSLTNDVAIELVLNKLDNCPLVCLYIDHDNVKEKYLVLLENSLSDEYLLTIQKDQGKII